MSEFTNFSAIMSVEYAHDESAILGRDIWRVTKGFRYYIGDLGSNKWVNVPAGYLTDGASSPKLLWSVVPPWGAYGQAAVVHDILCEYLSITVSGLPQAISRMEADRILREAMMVLKVPKEDMDRINLAVGLYREFSGTNRAVWHREKAALEAAWFTRQQLT